MSASPTIKEISSSLRSRIETVRRELKNHDALRDELTRLETALARLEDPAATQPNTPRRSPTAVGQRRSSSRSGAESPPKRDGRRATRSAAPRGQTRERIIEYLRSTGPSTAGEVAEGLQLNRNSVATRLTQLTKAGEIEKAQRGYAARSQRDNKPA